MKRNTVFVVGAGASKEFGLPLGSELQSQIAAMVNIKFQDGHNQSSGDYEIMHCCRVDSRERNFPDVNPYLYAGWLIHDGIKGTDSIDNFMKKHSESELLQFVAKLGIAKAISQAEASSLMNLADTSRQSKLDLQRLEHTWLVKLFRHIQRDVDKPDLAKFFEGVSFIVFNYDRCVEFFFVQAISLVYGVSTYDASQLVSSANIYHPYGSLGDLPECVNGGIGTLPFGAERPPLKSISERLFTYTESINDLEQLSTARTWIEHADQVVFLGFAYHPQNMDILTPAAMHNVAHFIGTSYGVSNYDSSIIEEDLLQRFEDSREEMSVNLASVTCSDLIENFGRAFH